MTSSGEHLLDVAGGDVATSRQLARTLRTLRDATPDPALRTVLDDVLAGRRSLREASTDPVYAAATAAGVRSVAPVWDAMSQEERDELARQGQRDLDRLAAEAADEQPEEDDFSDPLGRRRGL